MTETGVVVGLAGEPIHWHLPPGRSSVYLPDAPDLWDVFWTNRGRLLGFAHSHPGSGVPEPSLEDLTTFAAVEAGLGFRLVWWITSRDHLVQIGWGVDGYVTIPIVESQFTDSWVGNLRKLSYQR